MFYRRSDAEDLPDSALERARPFRLIQIVCAGDAVAGMILHFASPRLGVPGEVIGMPVLEFVGWALMAIGASGFIMFEFLKRAAMRRTDTPKPSR